MNFPVSSYCTKLERQTRSWPHAGPGCSTHFWFMTGNSPGACRVPFGVLGLYHTILVSTKLSVTVARPDQN